MLKWLKFIDSFYKKYGFQNASWDVAGLPIRVYASNNFGIIKRYNLLKNHYILMEQFFSFNLIKNLLSSNQIINISSITKKNGDLCYLNILCHDKFWREGGLILYLSDTNSKLIATLTFSFFCDEKNQKSIIIGGLQGGSSLEKSEIVQITRDLGGLRPKYALIECCYIIASYLNIGKIIGVSDNNHVFSYQDANFSRSYDNIWKDIGGILMKDKNYLLPAFLPKRDFDSVPQKKRKDWLIRHGHIDKLNSDIKSFLNKFS